MILKFKQNTICHLTWELHFSSTELIPNCQQMNCQYKCAIVRNSTRCYCEDGFEVKEDGRGCKGMHEIQFCLYPLSISVTKFLIVLT